MGKLGFTDFLREQLASVGPLTTVDLTGKTVMVIGANTGLGFEATKHFARMNPARLILACRSKTKGEAALEKLRKETSYRGAELGIIDLSDFSSVIAFADWFEKNGGRLDILVENAAVATSYYETTKDGYESTLQVNCLSLFLLTFRLLPQMITTAEKHATNPRLVVVTSEVHFWSGIPGDKEVLNAEEVYKLMSTKEYCTFRTMSRRYHDSKLLDMLFVQTLNERLGPQSPIIVNAVNPGLCYSELLRNTPFVLYYVALLIQTAIARTSEQGGRQLVYAAVGAAGDEDKLRGAYISSLRVSEASDFVIGEEGHLFQEKLWKEAVDILVKVDPRIKPVVADLGHSN